MIRVLDISQGTSVDGPGLRTSLYLAGCKHRCPGCHNPESWDMQGGKERTVEELMEVIAYNRFPITLSGGDPMYQAEELIPLLREVRLLFNAHPEWKQEGGIVWCYTGFEYEAIKDKSPYKELLEYIDVLVDGPYVESLRPARGLRFRGSSNQRFIRPQSGEEVVY